MRRASLTIQSSAGVEAIFDHGSTRIKMRGGDIRRLKRKISGNQSESKKKQDAIVSSEQIPLSRKDI